MWGSGPRVSGLRVEICSGLGFRVFGVGGVIRLALELLVRGVAGCNSGSGPGRVDLVFTSGCRVFGVAFVVWGS